MTRKQKIAYCRQWCTRKLGWNDEKRAYCRKNTACKDELKETKKLVK